jgi:hypothetical protein
MVRFLGAQGRLMYSATDTLFGVSVAVTRSML